MDQQTTNPQEQKPILCKNGCGFFGHPSSNNFCSKCWRDKKLQLGEEPKETKLQQKEQPKEIIQVTTSSVEKDKASEITVIPPIGSPEEVKKTSEQATKLPVADDKPQQTDTMHCWNCRRKVGLLGFRCRCNYIFCSKHRHADQHNCTFDYKALNRAKLEEQNPQIVKSKIEKI